MQLSVFGQSLDGSDLAAVRKDPKGQAGAYHLPVHQYCTGTAHAHAATLLAACEP